MQEESLGATEGLRHKDVWQVSTWKDNSGRACFPVWQDRETGRKNERCIVNSRQLSPASCELTWPPADAAQRPVRRRVRPPLLMLLRDLGGEGSGKGEVERWGAALLL